MFFIAWNSLRVDCYSSSAMERRGGERRAIVSQFLTCCHSSSCDGSVCQRVFEFWISQLVRKGKIKVQFPRLSELPIRHYPPATNTLLRLSFTRFFIYINRKGRKHTVKVIVGPEIRRKNAAWAWWCMCAFGDGAWECTGCEPRDLGLPFEPGLGNLPRHISHTKRAGK